MDEIDLIASGYEWTCSKCENFNQEIAIPEKVTCSQCQETFQVNEFWCKQQGQVGFAPFRTRCLAGIHHTREKEKTMIPKTGELTRKQALCLLEKGELRTTMLKPLGISFDTFLQFAQLEKPRRTALLQELARKGRENATLR